MLQVSTPASHTLPQPGAYLQCAAAALLQADSQACCQDSHGLLSVLLEPEPTGLLALRTRQHLLRHAPQGCLPTCTLLGIINTTYTLQIQHRSSPHWYYYTADARCAPKSWYTHVAFTLAAHAM